MHKLNRLEAIMDQAKPNTVYQQQLADLKEKEPAFLALMASLPEEQKNIIEAYLSACEELDHTLLRIACEMGQIER